MLQMRSQMYNYGSISVSMYDQISHLKNLRKKLALRQTPAGYAGLDHQTRQRRKKNISFGGVKTQKRKKKGAPRFKRSVRSLTWNLRKYKLKSGERVRQNPIRETGTRLDRLKVPQLGEVKIRQHRSVHRRPERGHVEKDGTRLVLLYRL